MEIDSKELKALYEWIFNHLVDSRAIAERIMVAEKALGHIKEVSMRANHYHEFNISALAIDKIEEIKK